MGEVTSVLYDSLIAPLDPIGVGKWRKWVVKSARGQVLELGIGTGLNLRYYENATIIAAVDPDRSFLRRALNRRNGHVNKITLFQATAESLPFANESFDAVVGTLVFCTIPDPMRALNEATRVLKPGGVLRLVEHVRVPNRQIAWVQEKVTPFWKQIAGGCHLDRDTASSVSQAGFQVRAVHSQLGGLFVSIDATKP